MQCRILAVWIGLLLCLPSFGGPVISEFMADNATTIADQDGDFTDWIEIHNPDSEPVALDGWFLTDSAKNLEKWSFPAGVTVPPGGFLVVWASSKDRRNPATELHTNFSLSKSGEFLALVRPDGVTKEQSFEPAFPPLETDASFGLRFHSTSLVAAGANGKFTVPTSAANPAADWKDISYADGSWASGTSGFGFGLELPGITVRQVIKNGVISNLNDALALIALPASNPQVLDSRTAIYDVVNILGEGNEGRYGNNSLPPAGSGGVNYAIVATGSLVIPATGTYTFGLNSDDGGCIDIDGQRVMTDDTFHGPQDHFGSKYLTAGSHTFQIVMFQGYGGEGLEFFAAPGVRTWFDASVFRLVGDVANGGLVATTAPPEAGGVIGTNIKSAMTGRNGAYIRMPFTAGDIAGATSMSLVMRYNDGFVASLNGAQVAASNAPASPVWDSLATATRNNSATLRRNAFDLTTSLPLLENGANVLAIHGMNSATASQDFLVLPELVIGNLFAEHGPVFYGAGRATPGWINGAPSSLGKIADTSFSVKRGFFTAPISVEITTPTAGATIRYTTDGSTPTDTHGTTYTGPLAISSTTVLRARAVKEEWDPTNVDTQTYFFPDDIITQSPSGAPYPGWPASSGTSQVMDFGMDPDIVNHPNPQVGGPATVKAALLALPSLSLATDISNLFNVNGSQGIYANPGNRGLAWERPVSAEWIEPPTSENPNGRSEFQIDAGLRIRGGYSRDSSNPKHALRLLFRSDYGYSRLRYPLFGPDAAQEFDKIDLRTAQNYSWSFGGDTQNTFLREEASRRTQLDMGQPASHLRYFHLYLNGQYWGLFNFDERTEARFAASYFGGDSSDYDCVKSNAAANYITEATDGNLAAFQDLFNKAKICRASPTNANYFKLMGLAADGVTPTSDPVLLDVDNLIDYMLLTMWMGNLDGSVSEFLGNNRANNWFGTRRRDNNPRQGFRFFAHDFEHSMFNVNEDRTGPYYSANESDFSFYNPAFIHQDLLGNPEYRQRWADRIHRHMFNDGALTPAAWAVRLGDMANTVETAIVAESARWGDAKRGNPLTRLDWLNARNQLFAYPTPRNPIVLGQLRGDSLYPGLEAPEFFPYGGYQPDGQEVVITTPGSATTYYMPDGTDPRAPGGTLRSGAVSYVSNTTSQALIPWSAPAWKYLGNGSDQGTAWRERIFNDSSWPVGPAELGYGDGDEATVVAIPPGPKPATCYFRRSFSAIDAAAITTLSVTVNYDDAYAVYLNGVRVAGDLPIDPPFNHYTGVAVENNPPVTTAISPALLREGTNVIAVEVHQSSPTSSDMSMNLSLNATRTTTSEPIVLHGNGHRILRARALSGSTWSALSEVSYLVGTVPVTPGSLVVSEILYRPEPNTDAEFLELLNTDPTNALDLGGARFTKGIDFVFPANFTLAPGGRVLLVRNTVQFESMFGTGIAIGGVFANDTALSNSGERLLLQSPTGEVLLDFAYGIDFPWPVSANGDGRSIVYTGGDPADPLSWRPSAVKNGNPGTTDFVPLPPSADLLAYAVPAAQPTVDLTNQTFSVTRRLGTDAVTLAPEWSTDLTAWQTTPLTFIAETPDNHGNSTLTWKLDPLPPGQAFLRLRVTEKP